MNSTIADVSIQFVSIKNQIPGKEFLFSFACRTREDFDPRGSKQRSLSLDGIDRLCRVKKGNNCLGCSYVYVINQMTPPLLHFRVKQTRPNPMEDFTCKICTTKVGNVKSMDGFG